MYTCHAGGDHSLAGIPTCSELDDGRQGTDLAADASQHQTTARQHSRTDRTINIKHGGGGGGERTSKQTPPLTQREILTCTCACTRTRTRTQHMTDQQCHHQQTTECIECIYATHEYACYMHHVNTSHRLLMSAHACVCVMPAACSHACVTHDDVHACSPHHNPAQSYKGILWLHMRYLPRQARNV